MNPAEFIGKIVTVSIDRPLGSMHPEYGFEYLLNYGFIPGAIATDGEEIDAYVLGVVEPITTFTGKCVAVIHRLNDNDDKLVIVPVNMEFSYEQIRDLTRFQEQFFQSIILQKTR